ncbi:uncharacterized protein LOC106080224 [Biomphalaria glabrata]|uniref:Uncharacterized protein LOC106080224 n=2 Tax=Biomphalaria glabrata TaxID=6526 RepID=A0A9W3AWA6_BIOGL|nr:uncharacterized protein LOC106080224 [Biomphalaria glabrata]XP_055891504.1 uncharacterized protein LOC106080224 [Biomphalaria glabrata]XP_055891505.1 uncharacterized protein LOC106080224 [Biomphalaria glabrata]
MIVQVDFEATSNLVSKLAQMQEQGKYCDFSIFVYDHEIKAHKCVLAACCEYFQTSFNFDQSSEPFSIDLTHVGCEPKYVEMVIRSFYTNEIDLDTSYLDSVLKLVDYFMCDSLRRCVETYMVNTLNFYTAVAYFQLSVQYNLNSKKLLSSTKWLLWYRFHDYFIYQPELLESSAEVVDALLKYNILHHSNPVHVLDFFLKNVQVRLTRLLDMNLQEGLKREIQYKLSHSFHSVKYWLDSMVDVPLDKWRSLLLDSVRAWKNTQENSSLQAMICLVNWVENRLQGLVDKESQVCADREECCVCHHETKCSRQSCKTVPDEDTNSAGKDRVLPATGTQSPVQEINGSVDLHRSGTTVQSLNADQSSLTRESTPLTSNDSPSLNNLTTQSCLPKSMELLSGSHRLSNILVVLAPSGKMASQLMAIEAEKGNSRPLLKLPQLDLAFYDIEMKTWRQVCQIDFPITGVMLEKHSWRMAFWNDCVYLFSVHKASALEFRLSDRQWHHLDGEKLFMDHNDCPVKSVVPIVVGSRLIVLSMSRKLMPCRSFYTVQNFYELNPTLKTFTLVASVKNSHLDEPITKWTVNGDTLITVKASSMMLKKFISVQFVNIYNAETRSSDAFEIDCTIESGVNVLTKGDILFLLDKEGWCRSYDLKTSTGLGFSRHPECKIVGSMKALFADDVYPALTRVTCQAGSSRWEITTNKTAVNACVKENYVDDENKIKVLFHPNPPFQFMTAMCPGQMQRQHLDQFGFPIFNFVDNRMLNFSITNRD